MTTLRWAAYNEGAYRPISSGISLLTTGRSIEFRGGFNLLRDHQARGAMMRNNNYYSITTRYKTRREHSIYLFTTSGRYANVFETIWEFMTLLIRDRRDGR